jgi:hypothetical protein
MNNLPNSHNSNNSNNNNHNNNNHHNNHHNSHSSSNNHHPHEVQTSDWHQRMANLVGLEEQISPSRPESSLSETPSANPDEAPPSHPSSLKTKQALSSNPFAKVGVVGAATLSVVLVAGAFLTQLMSGTNKQAPKNFPQITRNDNESNKIDQLKPEEEIEILKTKLALAEQTKAVRLAQLQLKSVRPTTQPKPTPAQPRTQPQTITRVVVQRVPTPTQTVYVPRVVERIVRVPQRVVAQQVKPTSPVLPQQTQQTQPPVSPQPPQQTPQPTAKPSISPSFELSIPGLKPSELAQIPFALSVPTPTPTPTATPTPTPTPNLPRVASSPPSTLGSELNPRTRDNPQILPVPNRRNTTANPEDTPEATNESTQYTGKSVAVGTNAKAVLATAVFGEANRIGSNSSNNNNNNNKNDSQFVVRLREPLRSINGEVALPANTQLLAQLDQVSESGMLNLKVVSVVSQNQNNPRPTNLDQSAMKVRAPGGRPLLAKKYPDKSGKISGMDTFIFALGGAGKIGEVLNRPETKIKRDEACLEYYRNNPINTANFAFSCPSFSETEQQRNIPAAVLEGGMNALVPQLNQRNQQAINEMITKSNIWYLPAGTEVEVVANQVTTF